MTPDQFLQFCGYVASAAGGGAMTELTRWLRKRGEKKEDLATAIRDELRGDNVTLRAEMVKLRADYVRQGEEIQQVRLDNSHLSGQMQALGEENTKLRNENLTQKGENAYLLAKVEMFEKLLAQLTDNKTAGMAAAALAATGTKPA